MDTIGSATPAMGQPSAMEGNLLERIRAFAFDDGETAFPFAARLARENRWSRDYAQRAIEEYRRFMFLAVTSGHPVTPSDQVDQVWHLHLLYTCSYWDRFCRETLGRRIDHGPTKGGPQESRKFTDWYERTLDSYRRVFGPPPEDIWPPAAVRFGDDLHYVRVNTRYNCIIPIVWLRALRALLFAGALLAMLLAHAMA